MASYGLYLNSIATPLVKNVLVGLGFGVVTYTGLQAAFSTLQSLVVNNLNSLPAQVASLMYLAGFNYSIGLILSACSMRLAMTAVKKLQLV